MRFFGWFREQRVPIPAEELKSGTCECGDARCYHIDGIGRCTIEYPPSEEFPYGSICQCVKFIRDEDDDGEDDEMPEPTDPEVAELQRISKL